MNYSDVFQKSDTGREEIKYHSLGVLPREARSLLIMIDGKRTYQNYLDTLDHSKMFAGFGGVAPLFELLLELECIEIVGQPDSGSEPSVSAQSKANDDTAKSNEIEFEQTFNTSQAREEIAVRPADSKQTAADEDYEKVKSALAAYIETNAKPEEAWEYLLG